MPWPQTGATRYNAQLGLPDIGRAIKGLVVCYSWELEPLDLLYGLVINRPLRSYDSYPYIAHTLQNIVLVLKLPITHTRNQGPIGKHRHTQVQPFCHGFNQFSRIIWPYNDVPGRNLHISKAWRMANCRERVLKVRWM